MYLSMKNIDSTFQNIDDANEETKIFELSLKNG